MTIRITKQRTCDGGNVEYVEIAGLSTDTKPCNAIFATGSRFFEVDTGKTFYYNEEDDGAWIDPTATE